MKRLSLTSGPLVGLGMASLVLGTVGLLLALLPVLGVPISAFGLALGLASLLVAWRKGGIRLRWTLAGIAVSALALGANVAIGYADRGFLPTWDLPGLWRQPPGPPTAPPPSP